MVTAIVQKTDELNIISDFQSSGFVFSPFLTGKKVFFPIEKCETSSSIYKKNDKKGLFENNPDIYVSTNIVSSKRKYLSLTKNALDCITKGITEKIVISRKEHLNVNNFCPLNSFKRMLDKYKNAFVYIWFHPKIGFWMGATPECLINIQENKLKTMALAGTQNFINSLDVFWEEKEKREQQLVTDYVLEKIKNSVDNLEVSKPYTIKAGNLLHIKTDICGILKSSNSMEKLIDNLHPTPAICGVPKDIAQNFIVKNESYNREYYTGYLGELNLNNSTNLYVNLRCMKVEDNNISIYVGGGITKNSIPENEWTETVIKAEIMKKVL